MVHGLEPFRVGHGRVFFSTAALALTAATFSGEARSRVIGLQQATSQVVNACAVFIVGALVGITGCGGAVSIVWRLRDPAVAPGAARPSADGPPAEVTAEPGASNPAAAA